VILSSALVEIASGLSALEVLIAVLILIFGPGGAAWVASHHAVRQIRESQKKFQDDMKEERQDLRSWLKSLERRQGQTEKELYAVRAVQLDRDSRELWGLRPPDPEREDDPK
jgi:Tfp pilus assembly protein PilV